MLHNEPCAHTTCIDVDRSPGWGPKCPDTAVEIAVGVFF